jgi:hypothetical protein
VIVQESGDHLTEVSAINPLESMKAVGNPELENIANQVSAKLKSVIERM